MKSVTLIICFAFSCFLQSRAQSSTKDELSKIADAGRQIKDLFSKKNKRRDSAAAQNGRSPNDEALLNRAGSLAPTARFLDADKLYYFSKGAALVIKGTSSALIDSAGNFIVPFNKFDIADKGIKPPDFPADGYHHGLFIVTEIATGKRGLLNSRGHFLPVADIGSAYMCGDLVAIKNLNQTYTYIDTNLHTYSMSRPFLNFHEGLGASYTGTVNQTGLKYGYKKITGQYAVQPQYDFADEFWEGRAIVGKINEFGEMKYGFIDMTGHEIFPLKLSNRPERFHGGFALIEPKDKSEFDYGFINRQGTLTIKRRWMKSGEIGEKFYCGYAQSRDGVLDTTGREITVVNFLNRFGITNFSTFFVPIEGQFQIQRFDEVDHSKFYYQAFDGTPYERLGFFDVVTRTKVKAMFDYSNIPCHLQFDKTSGLAYARVNLGEDRSAGTELYKYREGYINAKGEFVIMKKEASEW